MLALPGQKKKKQDEYSTIISTSWKPMRTGIRLAAIGRGYSYTCNQVNGHVYIVYLFLLAYRRSGENKPRNIF